MTEVPVTAQRLDRFGTVVEPRHVEHTFTVASSMQERLAGRVVWNVNSTAVGGGVAELLQSLVPYARGLGIDARWAVIQGTPEFFHITKRLHHALHGELGDGLPLDETARSTYEAVMHANAAEFAAAVRPRDLVLLHDPQTAGLAPHMIDAGALVIWRCHIGHDGQSEEGERGWAFLEPYLRDVPSFVFSRQAYVPRYCDPRRVTIICPTIDAFSPKNQLLDEDTVRAILVHVGLVEGPDGEQRAFTRLDGSPGRVDRQADIIRLGRAPAYGTPLVVQVSRWDPLKDPVGVLRGFARLTESHPSHGAELVLAGPNVTAVVDDPEGASTFDRVIAEWRALPHGVRRLIHLASLPMADVEENAAIVNALQRHAAVIVQKSLHEGFGLTVTEAMWKARPIVASAVGAIQDQIVDGVHGLLLADPSDLDAFGVAVRRLLEDPAYAAELGEHARERVRQEFLGLHHLLKLAALIEQLDKAYDNAGQPERFVAGHT
jgi:trehalose synthase